MGGPRVSLEAESFIVATWLKMEEEAKREEGKEPTAKEVLHGARKRMEEEKLHYTLPGIRKVQLILENARLNREQARLKAQAAHPGSLDEDRRWSLGCLNDHPIPPEALPVVLKVWKSYVMRGSPYFFSVRMAKWVARLYAVIPDIELIERWVLSYTQCEGTSEAMGKPFLETKGVDEALVMGDWELLTARLVGKASPLVSFFDRDTISPNRSLFVDSGADRTIEWAEHFALWKPLEVSSPELELSGEAAWVYILWLDYFRRTPKWRRLSTKKRMEIALKLRGWVLNHPWNYDWKKDRVAPPARVAFRRLLDKDYRRAVNHPQLIPSDILRDIGYKGRTHHKRPHKQTTLRKGV